MRLTLVGEGNETVFIKVWKRYSFLYCPRYAVLRAYGPCMIIGPSDSTLAALLGPKPFWAGHSAHCPFRFTIFVGPTKQVHAVT